MKWIETIEVRTTGGEDILKALDLKSIAAHLSGAGRPYGTVVLRHATLNGDIAIHLLSDTDRIPAEGSEVGLRLKEMLRGSGLVSHKIWIENERYPDGKIHHFKP